MLLFLQSASAALLGLGAIVPGLQPSRSLVTRAVANYLFGMRIEGGTKRVVPGALVRGSATLRVKAVCTDTSALLVDDRRSFSLQEFYDFVGVFGLHPDFYQGRLKMFQEQLKVRFVQTMISGPGMDFMKIFPRIHPPAQDHGNEHDLPRPQVRHVHSFKKMAQFLILRNFLVEQFGGSTNRLPSPDQFIKIFGHKLPDE
jgi:hypothetical protein